MNTFLLKEMRPIIAAFVLCIMSSTFAYSTADPLVIMPLEGPVYKEVQSSKAHLIRTAAINKCLLNTSGKVYSIQQGDKTSQLSNSTRVKVTLEKTDGKAKTEIKVCLWSEGVGMGLTSVKKTYVFESGNYKRTKTFTLFKAKDKKVVVYINNKSVGNTFSYKLRVDEI